MEKLQPLKNYILVKPIVDDKTKEGLFIPDQENKSEMGEVIGVGDIKNEYLTGKKVILKKYSGNTIDFNGEKYRVCEEKDLMLLIETI